jgi:hypothetical protein
VTLIRKRPSAATSYCLPTAIFLPLRPYDVSPDGQGFLMVKQKDRARITASQMILVQNWLEELTLPQYRLSLRSEGL